MSAGPPLLIISGFDGSVTALAFAKPFSTATTSLLFTLRAKKCGLTRTSSSATHPRVFPSPCRGCPALPEPGQDGVETCITKPFPLASQAIIPLEWPQGAPNV